ncbi:hypothetical protein OH76DRAFT_1066313 [Lentinus brumalis]|uniref:Uncharacterized protein n=1 Tax=Lentinus brumalis TaxID=2498619 RepID=A0A371DNP6_9APHY|nr:hypothetical protein OH76DRAFT_1066313 [Polyporus brumalis]
MRGRVTDVCKCGVIIGSVDLYRPVRQYPDGTLTFILWPLVMQLPRHPGKRGSRTNSWWGVGSLWSDTSHTFTNRLCARLVSSLPDLFATSCASSSGRVRSRGTHGATRRACGCGRRTMFGCQPRGTCECNR